LTNAILHLEMTRDASPAGNYAEGFCGYSYAVPYLSGTWAGFTNSLVPYVTPTWDDIPTMPWKTSPTTSHVMGTVTIVGTGAWADGATVSLTGPVSRVQTNDGTGFYAFIDLPVGSYTVAASLGGYPSATGTVAVAVGEVTGNMYQLNLVLGGDTLLAIITQPQDQNVNQGSNAVFSVLATGTPAPTYQWRFNGTNLAGATDTSYLLANAQPTDAGSYSVVVSNIAGMATSSNAVLNVTQPVPPRIDSINLMPGGQIQLQVSGSPGHYAIEATSDLADWSELTNFTITGGVFQHVDTETNLTQRFYRARRIP